MHALARLTGGLTSGMNKTEGRYADYLTMLEYSGDVLQWDYEPEKLRLADNCLYIPDFRVVLADRVIEMIDVKACMRDGKPLVRDDALVKMKVASELHPYRFVMTWNHQGRWVQRVFKDD